LQVYPGTGWKENCDKPLKQKTSWNLQEVSKYDAETETYAIMCCNILIIIFEFSQIPLEIPPKLFGAVFWHWFHFFLTLPNPSYFIKAVTRPTWDTQSSELVQVDLKYALLQQYAEI